MAEAGVDTLVTFNPSNIAYLCGHFSTNLHDFQRLAVSQTRAPLMVLWYFELARFHASAVGATAEAYDTGDDPVTFLAARPRSRKPRRITAASRPASGERSRRGGRAGRGGAGRAGRA